jgi:hypothetical protein
MDKHLLAFAADEQLMRKRQGRNLLVLAVAVVVGLGGLVYALKEVARANQPAKVVIDPARLPPITPGPR